MGHQVSGFVGFALSPDAGVPQLGAGLKTFPGGDPAAWVTTGDKFLVLCWNAPR
jgi:hypothetical protein